MAGLLNIGLTGLNAAQMQLNTASHNIANAATPGFSRQAVVQTTNNPLFSGAGFFGQGVRVTNITRQYSQFLENQVLSADNRLSEYSAYGAQISQLNNMLADPDVGLSPALQNFFAGVQEVAANPSSAAARQALLSAGQQLATRFQTMDTRISEVRAGTEGEIASTVETINSLAFQIADLNKRISLAQAAGGGVQPNDLLDQRNHTLSELNKLVKTSSVVAADGQMSVFIGTGQNLVLGQNVTQLGTAPDPADPSRLAVVMLAPNGTQIPLAEKVLTGGALGGLLAFRRESLDVVQDRLNLIARQVTEAFNAQHRLGIDLNEALGLDFFRSNMVQRGSGTSDPPSVEIMDDRLLTNDRYTLTYDSSAPNNYTLTRVSDGAVIADPENELGLRITLPASGTDGDTFFIEPLRNAARDMAVAISDPSRIAAGSPIASEVPLGNAGSGALSNITMLSTEGMVATSPRFPPFEIAFSGNTLAFSASSPAGMVITPADYNPATDASGRQYTVSIPGAGAEGTFTFTLSGTPRDGDVFRFSANEDAVADNRNAVALGALQTTRTMLNSAPGEASATFQSAYSQLVSQVGNKTREVQVGEQAQASMLQQAQDSRDALSGVNLDEEAANLIRYQQAYQASGRVMSIAQRLFDELLAIGR